MSSGMIEAVLLNPSPKRKAKKMATKKRATKKPVAKKRKNPAKPRKRSVAAKPARRRRRVANPAPKRRRRRRNPKTNLRTALKIGGAAALGTIGGLIVSAFGYNALQESGAPAPLRAALFTTAGLALAGFGPVSRPAAMGAGGVMAAYGLADGYQQVKSAVSDEKSNNGETTDGAKSLMGGGGPVRMGSGSGAGGSTAIKGVRSARFAGLQPNLGGVTVPSFL